MHIDIAPTTIRISDDELDDLRRRLRAARWPDQLSGTGAERGIPLDIVAGLARYWAEDFDWRSQEAALNDIPQVLATIDGQPVHVFHIRSARPDATPLLLTHGWPSTSAEFRDVIRPLTAPDDDGPAFDLVIPSLPGYGLSTPLTDPGWGNLFRVAQAWDLLMTELGYERYAVHGTDAGGGVATILGMIAPDRVVGVHLTGTSAAMPFGPPLDAERFKGRDRERAESFNRIQQDGLGYLHLQATRPQTLGYALSDSPIAQLAWIAEKFAEWTDPAKRRLEEAVDRDALLTAVSLAWFHRAGASSAHAVYEGMRVYRQLASGGDEWGADDPAPAPPTAVAVFAADDTIRELFDPAGVMRWTEYDRGGHFPAMETPDLLVLDLREFFGPLA